MEDKVVVVLLTRDQAEKIVGRKLTDEEWKGIKDDLESDFSYLSCEVEPQILDVLESYKEEE